MYRYPKIVRLIKCRRLRWAGHVLIMGERRSAFNILTGNPKGSRRRMISFFFVFVLMGWSLLPNDLLPFKIYCDPPNLDIRT